MRLPRTLCEVEGVMVMECSALEISFLRVCTATSGANMFLRVAAGLLVSQIVEGHATPHAMLGNDMSHGMTVQYVEQFLNSQLSNATGTSS